jgi:predicted RNA-binding Zn ribbon-like protein
VDFSHYSGWPTEVAVELVNTLNVVSGEDLLTTPADVAVFVQAHDGEWCPPDWEPSDRDLREMQALRSRLREAFAATDEAQAAEGLNAILEDVGAVPRVSVHGDRPHLHFEPEQGSPVRWLGAITAMGLSVALIEGGFQRFGICASTTCEDVFVDGSRNRSRRHCSDTCTTREAVAAYRTRRRAQP